MNVGFVSDGAGPAADNTYQVAAAEATVKYINTYKGGIAGRPIALEECETAFDPGKATDCANELVQKDVVAVMMPESSAALSVYNVLKENKIPIFAYGVGDSALLTDSTVMSALVDPLSGLADAPIAVAKANDLKKVTVVIVDVPAATAFYSSLAPATFKEAGVELKVVPIPLDQADVTPQMTAIATGDPTEVHIVGQDTFCISTMQGLASAGFNGPISTLSSCVTDATKTALGAKLEGVYISSATANGDIAEKGIELWNAVADQNKIPTGDVNKSLPTYITVLSFRDALEGMTGEVTPETVRAEVVAMPSTRLPGGAGLDYRCNGKARPVLPAVCGNGNLTSKLDENGDPTLPWTIVGNAPIPG
ncbi:ABC transporter substrate-binding protein [Aquihabitans sp. McL0605]|uniref:ABC transporter substrate-binding protein n=1 Tax=Aquihabitans sp. McL0605 TaxID=3415671 RepID=UPI003CF48D14